MGCCYWLLRRSVLKTCWIVLRWLLWANFETELFLNVFICCYYLFHLTENHVISCKCPRGPELTCSLKGLPHSLHLRCSSRCVNYTLAEAFTSHYGTWSLFCLWVLFKPSVCVVGYVDLHASPFVFQNRSGWKHIVGVLWEENKR